MNNQDDSVVDIFFVKEKFLEESQTLSHFCKSNPLYGSKNHEDVHPQGSENLL